MGFNGVPLGLKLCLYMSFCDPQGGLILLSPQENHQSRRHFGGGADFLLHMQCRRTPGRKLGPMLCPSSLSLSLIERRWRFTDGALTDMIMDGWIYFYIN